MLIELALRGRLQLEACGMRRKSLLTRKVSGVVVSFAFEFCFRQCCSYKLQSVVTKQAF